MGKKWRGNRGGGGARGRGGKSGGQRGGWGGGQRPAHRSSSGEIPRFNEKFESYYNDLGILDEDEMGTFWQSMRSDLPNSFRFAGSRGHALTVQRRLIDHYIPEITAVEYEGEKVPPPTAIQWYPDRLAWSMTTPKNVIRKFPPFASFQKFLVSENSVGNITRQEIVSMIPPLFMDLKPGMTVLDLCAAPGSKSAQIIELVHGGEEARVRQVRETIAKQQGRELSPGGMEVDAEKDQAAQEEDYSDDGRATGLLIANDKEYKRAQMLVHQCKRLNSPNLIVTNHDATMFPSLKLPSGSGQKYLKFDRILADVPCSGDGTSRKNLNVWRDWNPANGLGLHATQVRILVRALQMLKVGGKVVYSTCSLNPVEDEAVVAEAVDRCGGSDNVKLADTRGCLPGLERKEGLTSWSVMDKNGKIWYTHDEVAQAKEGQTEEYMAKLHEGMFPPKPEAEIPLHRCTRVYPHLQDTGGFFIAVLEKQTEIRARPENAKADNIPKEKPIVSKILDEVQNEPGTIANGAAESSADLEKVTTPSKHASPPESNAPPVVRQNQEVEPTNTGLSTARKRSLNPEGGDDIDTRTELAAKRLKHEAAPDAANPDVAGPGQHGNPNVPTRLEHYPPPPTTHLDLNTHSSGHPPPPPALAKRPNPNTPHEEPFKYLAITHPTLETVTRFYAISSRFPKTRFMVRNATGEPVKSIYYTSTLARDILRENEGKGIKFVHCGVKMFVKQDVSGIDGACAWRIQNEGLPIVEPWVGEGRIVRLSSKDKGGKTLRKLLREMFPRVHEGNVAEGLEDIAAQIEDMAVGCCVLRVEPEDESDGGREENSGLREKLVLPLWRGINSVNVMLPKEDRKAMLLRLFDDETPLVDASAQNREKKQRERDEAEASTSRSARVRTSPAREGAGDAAIQSGGEVDRNGEVGDGADADAAQEDMKEEEEDEEEEDGGVRLPNESTMEQQIEEAEDAITAERQNQKDAYKEAAPGVADEDDAANKTV